MQLDCNQESEAEIVCESYFGLDKIFIGNVFVVWVDTRKLRVLRWNLVRNL